MSDSGRDAHRGRMAVADAAVSRYETLPLDQVREELRTAGIDPASTIAAVKKLVEDSLTKSKQARDAPAVSRPHKPTSQRLPTFVPTAHHDAGTDDNF